MTDPAKGAPSQVVESDVIVVGAGPGGATAARHLADRGLAVSLLEKSSFPRDKVCGDGLTPRAVKQLIRLGVDVSPRPVGCTTTGCASRRTSSRSCCHGPNSTHSPTLRGQTPQRI